MGLRYPVVLGSTVVPDGRSCASYLARYRSEFRRFASFFVVLESEFRQSNSERGVANHWAVAVICNAVWDMAFNRHIEGKL